MIMGPDYELGLKRLRIALSNKFPQLPSEFTLLEARLLRNLHEARKYGDEPTNKAEWTKIIEGLISIAHEQLGIDFNELCWTQAHVTVPLVFPVGEQLVGTKGDDSGEKRLPRYDGMGKRWAVLVGVDRYQDAVYPPLQVCTKDLTAISQQLLSSGFDTKCIHVLSEQSSNMPTRENTLALFKRVARHTQPDDLLLFYYTGHGDIEGNESYLVTSNGRYEDLEDTAIPIVRIKQIMKQAPARAKVIVLDACHGGAAIGSKGPRRMSAQFIQTVFEQAEGIAILSSCEQDQISYEWIEKERSVFTYYLLQALQGAADYHDKGFVTVADVHRYVTEGVKEWALDHQKMQWPTLQAEMVGEIIFCYYQQHKP